MPLFLAVYGVRELVIFGTLWTLLAVGGAFIHPAVAIVPVLLLVWTFAFFRDPRRRIPREPGLLVSPADGTVTEITEVESPEFLGEPSMRIGIFLSVFNVHINRAPCDGVVEATKYTPGKFLDARHPDCGRLNESNAVVLKRPSGRVLVRQISGAIARRIVCACREQDRLERGQKFGMIKFGSRTELYVPKRLLTEISVKVGDKVKGGESILARTTD